jgi:hypothetical protein
LKYFSFGALLGTTLILASCATLAPCPTPQALAPVLTVDTIDSVVFLVGDAGEPDPRGESVLRALRVAVAEALAAFGGERVTVVFLGDNLYPDGLMAATDAERRALEARLDAQLGVLSGFVAKPLGIFIPGNHDWGGDAKDGAERLARQADYLTSRGAGLARFEPPAGCPGPVVIDRGDRLRLVALDSQWYLRRGKLPYCGKGGRAEALRQLEASIAGAGGRQVVVVAHHPLESGSEHGAHRFPALLGFDRQDIPNPRYRRMKKDFEAIFRRAPPLLYAAGHDHTLQVLRGDGYPLQLISGAGTSTRLSAVKALPSTLACRQGTGFARLDLARDGRARLALLHPAEYAVGSREFWSLFFEP